MLSSIINSGKVPVLLAPMAGITDLPFRNAVNKFGVDINTFKKIIRSYKNSKFLEFNCLSVHIGSQITSHQPYRTMLNVIQKCLNECNHKFRYIDLGGGTVSYTHLTLLTNREV